MSAGIPSQLESVWRERLICVPEDRDQHGRRVFIIRLGKWDPVNISTRLLFTAAFSLFELIALEEKTQIAGVTVVADISGFGLKHLKLVSLILVCFQLLSMTFNDWVGFGNVFSGLWLWLELRAQSPITDRQRFTIHF